MNRKKLLHGVSLLLWAMIGVGMLAMLGKLYHGYLQYGEGTIRLGNAYRTEDVQNVGNSGAQELQMTEVDDRENIRVCLRTSDYGTVEHDSVELTGSAPYQVSWIFRNDEGSHDRIEGDAEQKRAAESAAEPETGEKTEEIYEYKPGDHLTVTANDLKEGDILRIEGRNAVFMICSISRAQGVPEYSGTFYLCRTAGGILLINELSLEDYLPSVVASEMPSSYPEEAQKTQAVCARTYAVNCMKNRGSDDSYEQILLKWAQSEGREARQLYDLDDSVEFQVYNNQKATECSIHAVKATAGEIMERDEVLYYSTSAGTQKRNDLGSDEAFRSFLKEKPEEDAEYGSPWLRWEVQLEEQLIVSRINDYLRKGVKALELEEYADRMDSGNEMQMTDQAGKETGFTPFGQITDIRILERSGQGQVQKLSISDGDNSVVISGEYWIRKVLSTENSSIQLRNGKTAGGMSMLPSAYFILEGSGVLSEKQVSEDPGEERKRDETKIDSVITVRGGGYGHGIGMSQYGAAAMAQAGSSYREILEYYYGTEN